MKKCLSWRTQNFRKKTSCETFGGWESRAGNELSPECSAAGKLTAELVTFSAPHRQPKCCLAGAGWSGHCQAQCLLLRVQPIDFAASSAPRPGDCLSTGCESPQASIGLSHKTCTELPGTESFRNTAGGCSRHCATLGSDLHPGHTNAPG